MWGGADLAEDTLPYVTVVCSITIYSDNTIQYSRYRMLSIFRISIIRYSIQNSPYLMDFLDLES